MASFGNSSAPVSPVDNPSNEGENSNSLVVLLVTIAKLSVLFTGIFVVIRMSRGEEITFFDKEN